MTATINQTQVSIAGALTAVTPGGLPFRFTASDARGGAADRPRPRVEPPQAAAPAAAGTPAEVAAYLRGPAALPDPRQGRHPPPLRRVEHVLRVDPRPVDDLHL